MNPTDLPLQPLALDTSTAGLILDAGHFARLTDVATMMASGSATVPKHLRGNKADCFAVAMQAMQWGKNPFAVAQKTHLVHGTLGYEAQLIIAIINTSGAIVGSLAFEWFGDWSRIVGKFKEIISKKVKDEDTGEFQKYRVPDWTMEDEEGLGVTCRAALRHTPGQVRELKLLLKQARTRNSTLWADDPAMQLAYLAGKKWGRLNTPEVILGMYSPDELSAGGGKPVDMGLADVIEPGSQTALTAAQLATWEAAARKGTEAARKHFQSMGKTLRGLATEAQKNSMWDIATAADKASATDVTPKATAAASADGARATDQAATPKAQTENSAAGAATKTGDPFVDDYNAAEIAGGKQP